ncbi:MAG: SDR family NAD(P)-dependent oxidoreductase, partial [Pontibacterium sp.]
GYHTAIELQLRGYKVLATARQTKDVDMLRSKGLNAHQLDLRSSPSINQAFAWAMQESQGRIYALFNNGAYGQPGAVEDLSRDLLREQLEVNLLGWHELTNLVLPVMRKHGEGRIIQNSSILGFITLAYRGAYNCSKFALEGLTDTLRLELKGSGICVSLIEPGPIESHFRQNAYQAFLNNIDRKNSAHAQVYEGVDRRLAGKNLIKDTEPFTLPASAVVKCVIHALESKNPKARYRVTTPTHLMHILKRLTSTRFLDKILSRLSEREND